MKIISKQCLSDLEKKTPLRLNLGAGLGRRSGYYGVDHLQLEGTDILADLNKDLDLIPDNSVSDIYSSHVFEHIANFESLMNEIHRISQPSANIEIVVPHFSNPYGYSDPTHVRLFGLYTFYYFSPLDLQPAKRRVPSFYGNAQFRVKSVRIEFYKQGMLDAILAPLFVRLFNLTIPMQDFYERRLSSLFHAAQIRYHLEPIKK